jgi:hypothetical protein
MTYLKFSLGIFLVLAASRFIPHPPNFTNLVALSFYMPAIFGIKYIYTVLIAFIITDTFIGLHSNILYTWGSVVIIGLIAPSFNKNIFCRISGVLAGCLIFYIITNFGVWTSGFYGYHLDGLITCYVMAIPFFGNTVISTILYSTIIEALYKILKKPISNIYSKL